MTTKRVIQLKPRVNTREEFVANAAITPGHLVEIMSTGKIRVHANAGQNAAAMFALEDVYQGNTISDAFASGDKVQVWKCVPGEEVNAILKNGENVAIGDFLESAGDGTLQKHSAGSAGVVEYPKAIVGIAREAVDMSGSSAVDPSPRIRVEIV